MGTQNIVPCVKKEGERTKVMIFMCLLRIEVKQTDIFITLNVPLTDQDNSERIANSRSMFMNVLKYLTITNLNAFDME
jgi:hypothetical protein